MMNTPFTFKNIYFSINYYYILVKCAKQVILLVIILNFCIFCICCNYSKQIPVQDRPTHAMQAAALPGAHTPRHPLNTHRLRSHLQNSV